jgi:hypothetical protein
MGGVHIKDMNSNVLQTEVHRNRIGLVILVHQGKCGVVVRIEVDNLLHAIFERDLDHEVIRNMDTTAELCIHVSRHATGSVEVNGHAACQIDIQRAAQQQTLLQLLKEFSQAFRKRGM